MAKKVVTFGEIMLRLAPEGDVYKRQCIDSLYIVKRTKIKRENEGGFIC